ncbi:type IV secretion protein Dot [Legionella norrlandica]|uniref:Type IV secretion protein Dot n=1 Tax=Legionella norrlandica TaxID=1498499 RepID=A0A0A2T843_9GAMM|nr:type IV secretion protein Dot [Legionella norrlandica]KGP63588.1 type IV secretion protein Dot [Legionella norrlandica]
MLTLSLAKCINATKNGSFSIKDLGLSDTLSYEDVVFLAEYLKATPLTDLDLSMTMTEENSKALWNLSQVISQNSQLEKLTFEITLDFNFYSKHVLSVGLFDFIDERRLKKIAARVNEALLDILNNKPALKKLTVDLLPLDTSLTNKQIRRLTQAINQPPLTYLNLAFSVAKSAQIPLFNSKKPITSLEFLTLRGFASGRNVLQYLPKASALKTLAIHDMQFDKTDFLLLDKIIKSNPTLDTLIINKTNIGQINSPQVLSWLKSCSHLSNLSLAENNLSLLNVDFLCDFLASNPENLKELNLSKNAYMAADVIKIAKALTSNTHIEKLVLDENYIENEGLQAILNLVKTNKNIRSISISNTCRYTPSNEIIQTLCNLLIDPECQLQELQFNQDITLAQYIMLQYVLNFNKSIESIDLRFRYPNIRQMTLNDSNDASTQGLSDNNSDSMVRTNPKEKGEKPGTIKNSQLFFIPRSNQCKEDKEQLAIFSSPGVGYTQ